MHAQGRRVRARLCLSGEGAAGTADDLNRNDDVRVAASEAKLEVEHDAVGLLSRIPVGRGIWARREAREAPLPTLEVQAETWEAQSRSATEALDRTRL